MNIKYPLAILFFTIILNNAIVIIRMTKVISNDYFNLITINLIIKSIAALWIIILILKSNSILELLRNNKENDHPEILDI